MEKIIKHTERTIHKIVIGVNPKDGLVFKLNQNAGKVGSGWVVSKIIEDENNFHLFGLICYRVYYKTKEGEEMQWKKIISSSVVIEFDSEDEKTYA